MPQNKVLCLMTCYVYAITLFLFRSSGLVIECLLDAGADPNVQNVAGETPLMIASRNGCYMAVKVLANHPNCNSNVMVITTI